ncbi:MAG: hypothetical protein ACE5J2_00475 [Nitrososphaerales archaeon]
MRGLRACPICPECGSVKFKVIRNKGKNVVIECLKCTKKMKI